MIHTVADFLEALMEKQRERLPKYNDIQHTGLFGDMYEGLAKDLIDRALFDGMDLRVASGKIRNSKGDLSGQIDCMVVLGPGQEIPYTQHSIYHIEKVLMIVEVKKTMHGAKLKEALDLFRCFWKEISEVGQPKTGLINDAWRALFKKNLPSETQVNNLPFHEQMIYHSIHVEAVLPLRVVFGFDGYVDEYGLREGFVDYLEEVAKQPLDVRPRFNINAFPNLIICRKASLIKLDGMPYSGMIDGRGFWWWMGSRRSGPFHSLLEILWTRLAFIFKLGPEIFGEDLEMEEIHPLLAAKAQQLDSRQGAWQYENLAISRLDLKKVDDQQAWHPPTLNIAEFAIVNELCRSGSLDLVEPTLGQFLTKQGETAESISKSLNEKRLTTADGQKLTLITDECVCMILPDRRFVAAENKSGRLLRYAMKVTEELRRRRAKELTKPTASAVESPVIRDNIETASKSMENESQPGST